MIGSLSGTLKRKSPSGCIIEVGGVGYLVTTSVQSYTRLPAEGSAVSLEIYTAVREDAINLYGFFSVEEKETFLKLTSISGIGPKLAINILSGIAPRDLALAISRQDLPRLSSIPGIGKKTAERIIVELKDKFRFVIDEVATPHGEGARGLYDDALSALVNLGYKRPSVEQILSKVKWTPATTLEGVLKQSLKSLSVSGAGS